MSELSNNSPGRPFQTDHLNIETHRRLISDDVQEMTGIFEYSDSLTDQRVLTIPRLSEQAKIHQNLLQYRIPVYPVLKTDERNILVGVPSDARTITDALKFIARDVVHYSEIFSQIGVVLGRCAVSNFGLPEKLINRSVLGGIAFSVDDNEAFGGNVHLLPPYAFNPTTDKTTELSVIHDELLESRYIQEPVANELLRAASAGWESVRS